MKQTLQHALISAAVLAMAATQLFAADTAPSKAEAVNPLAPARARIADKKWAEAIDELRKVGDVGSADWNNLMGYSLRKGKTPDYAAAERFYDTALRIDPKHRGALEYSGELYLMLGDLGRAEQRLAALDKVCGFGCEEFSALKQAVQNYKANGNKVLGQES